MSDLTINAQPDPWLAIVERVITTPDLAIDNLERILALRDRERHGAALEEFNNAFAACQAEIKQIAKDKPNPAFKSNYSTLAAVDEEIRPVREKYGFGWLVSQATAESPDNVRFEGILSKGRIEKTVWLEVGRKAFTGEGPQGGRMAQLPIQIVGSITTYMRRYLLMMAFDVVPSDDIVDDDGEVMRRSGYKPPSPPPQPGNGQAAPPPSNGEERAKRWRVWIDARAKEMSLATDHAALNALGQREAGVVAKLKGDEQKEWDEVMKRARARIDKADREAKEAAKEATDVDPIQELLDEVAAMDSYDLDQLQTNAVWRAKVKDLFPLDEDRLNDAISARRIELKSS